MLNTPSIFKAPDSAGKAVGSYQAGCSYYNGQSAVTCTNYNGKCIDTSYTPTNVDAGAGVVVGALVAIGIAIIS